MDVHLCNTRKLTKSNHYCSVPQCKNDYASDNISMHGFPKNIKRRREWKIRLRIGKPITDNMKVCSAHFTKEDYILPDFAHKRKCLKQTAYPTRNLPQIRHKSIINYDLNAKRAERRSHRQQLTEKALNLEAAKALLLLANTENKEEEPANEMECDNAVKVYKDCSVQVNTYLDQREFSVADIINNEYRIKFCTGISTITLFNVIANALSKEFPTTNRNNIFCVRKRILLTLMKIKLGLSFRFLAVLFNISESVTRKYFKDTCKVMSVYMKVFLTFPSKDEILKNIPKCFEKYKKCRLILDCTEIPVQKSKCLKCRIRTYSHYKKDHTVKVLIGVSPSGMLTYLSKAYGGRASDKSIFNKECVISKLIPGADAIMVDKGFLIEDECKQHFIQLIRPPFLGKNRKQFSKQEAEETASIARARIHVERLIQKLKLFAMLRYKLSWSLLPYIDDVLIIVGALVNLSEPILSKEKF